MARVTNHRSKNILRGLAVLMLLLMVFLGLGVVCISYIASLYLFFGALFAWFALMYIGTNKYVCLSRFNKFFSLFIKLTNYLYSYYFVVNLYLIACIIFFYNYELYDYLLVYPLSKSLIRREQPYFDYYQLVITPKHLNLEKFTLKEKLLRIHPVFEQELLEKKEALLKKSKLNLRNSKSLKKELTFNIFTNRKNTIGVSNKGLYHSSDIGLIVKELEIKPFNVNNKGIILCY